MITDLSVLDGQHRAFTPVPTGMPALDVRQALDERPKPRVQRLC
jgi:hypothetical protein